MEYKSIDGNTLKFTPGKVVCVGRNYIRHIKELSNEVPDEPVLFMKPSTAMIDYEDGISLPKRFGAVHHELELAVLITEKLKNASVEAVKNSPFLFTVALDLTFRDLQQQLKDRGLPWEKAKSFDGSCVLGRWIEDFLLEKAQNAEIHLSINNEIRQHANTREMITPIAELISYASDFFTLMPGDVILTGTPAGVGALNPGDRLVMTLNEISFPVQALS